MRVIASLLVGLTLVLAQQLRFPTRFVAVSEFGLVQSTDVTYAGAFKFALAAHENLKGGFTGALAYKSSDDTFLIADQDEKVCGFSTPALVDGAFASLNQTTLTQACTDVLDGELVKVDGQKATGIGLTGLMLDGSDLYVTANLSYDDNGSQILSHFKSTNPFGGTPTVLGPYQVGDIGLPTNDQGMTTASLSNGGFMGGAIVPVPSAYQAALGGDTLTGMGVWRSIVTRSSYGPSISVFNRGDIGDFNATPPLDDGPGGTDRYAAYSTFAPAFTLIAYPSTHQTLGGYADGGTGSFPLTGPRGTDNFDIIYAAAGAVWIDGTDTIIFAARKGTTGNSCYGPGTSSASNSWPSESCQVWTVAGVPTMGADCNVPPASGVATPHEWCYDPTSSAEGTHAYPNHIIFQAYDVQDLIAVKNGTFDPWEIEPYATWEADINYTDEYVRGMTYDNVNRLLYISVLQSVYPGTCCYNVPVIHGFNVAVPAPRPTPAPKPTSMSWVMVLAATAATWSIVGLLASRRS